MPHMINCFLNNGSFAWKRKPHMTKIIGSYQNPAWTNEMKPNVLKLVVTLYVQMNHHYHILWSCVLTMCFALYLGEATPSDINAYMCAQDLFIGGQFTLQKRVQGMTLFKIKVNACILTHPIIKYISSGEHLKIPYFTYIAFSLIPQAINFFDFTPFLLFFFLFFFP